MNRHISESVNHGSGYIFHFLVCFLFVLPTDAFANDEAKQLSQHGIALAQKGEMQAAIEAFDHAIQLNPQDGHVYLHLANAYLATSNLGAATQACQKAIHLLPEAAEAYATLGQIFHRNGKLESAMVEYQKAIGLNAEIAEYHYDLGNIYHSLGRLKAAEEAYQVALRLKPKLATVYHNLAEIYQPQGKLDEAIEAYQQALKYSPDDEYTKKQLAEVNRKKMQKVAREILHYQTAISLHPTQAQNYKQLALAYYRNRQLEEAIESLRLALYLQPDSEQARFDLESVLQQKEKSLNTALEKARAQPENHKVQYTIGIIYLSKGDFPTATKHFRQALESDSTSAIVWLKLGEALQSSGEPKEARKAFRQAIRFQPNLSEAHQRLGILEKEIGNLDAAINHLEKATSAVTSAKARVASAKTYYHLGEAYHRKKQLTAAMAAYHTAIRLKPDTVSAYLQLGAIYAEMGNQGATLTFYRRFIAIVRPRPEFHQQMRSAEKLLNEMKIAN